MSKTSSEYAPKVRVPPPALPVVAIIIGYWLDKKIPLPFGFDLPTPDRYWIGGVLVVLTILVLGVWPALAFRRAKEDLVPWTPSAEMIVSGPFRYSRNPMYLMMVLTCAGFSIIFSSLWILLLTPFCGLALYLLAIRPEEAYLEETFGQSYRDYKKRVRRWI